jgi:hypothetical protein
MSLNYLKITDKQLNIFCRSHDQFIYASYEYYSDLFKPSLIKDTLVMNILDYFDEKWNETKSNSANGEEKEFKYSKKLFDKYGKNGSKAYRNTKPQKLIVEIQKFESKKTVKVYNMRKLNLLLPTILLLDNLSLKVDYLKKLIYFNFDFIFTKAKICQLDFIFDMQQILNGYIMNLKIDKKLQNEISELIKINKIYKENYFSILEKPSSIGLQMSRFETESELVKRFLKESIKECGLLVSKEYLTETNEYIDLYHSQSNKTIEKIYWMNSSQLPDIFIKSCRNTANSEESEINNYLLTEMFIEISLFSYYSFKNYGSFSFAENVKIIDILIINEFKDKLCDCEGGILYLDETNKILLKKFNDETKFIYDYEPILRDNNQEIKFLKILSSSCMLIQLVSGYNIIDFQKNTIIDYSNNLNTYIVSTEVNIDNQIVYSSNDMDKIEKVTITNFVIDFNTHSYENKSLIIYSFNKNLKKIAKICDIDLKAYKFSVSNISFWFDDLFKMNNYKIDDNIVTRFVVYSEIDGDMIICEIKVDGKFKLDLITYKTLGLKKKYFYLDAADDTDSDSDYIEFSEGSVQDEEHVFKNLIIINFCNKKLVLKRLNKMKYYNIYVYNLGKNFKRII